MSLVALRRDYHCQICEQILAIQSGVPNISDKSSKASVEIALSLVRRLGYPLASKPSSPQRRGVLFEQITKEFLEKAFQLLHHLRPGRWRFSVSESIAVFDQYEHLANLQRILKENPDLVSALGEDYLVTPDIVIGRYPVSDEEINRFAPLVSETDPTCRLTPFRASNYPNPRPILHASISCKWTIRSDRAQNIRTEALNLIRNRKGHVPHIAAVTAEPLPTRLASLALGTGDLDCVYHFALPELQKAVEEVGSKEQLEVLQGMIEGRRLRDISDLPFDLAT